MREHERVAGRQGDLSLQHDRRPNGVRVLVPSCRPQLVQPVVRLDRLAQLGSADGLVTLSAVSATLRLPRVNTLKGLTRFLEAYVEQILLPLELPGIYRAFHHASRHE